MTQTNFHVAAIGNALVDIIANVSEEFLETHNMTKGAMTLIDAERAEQLYAVIGSAMEMSGGSAANTIAGIASLGGRGAFMGKVKTDQLGTIFRHDLQAQGVLYTTPSTYKTDTPTGRCLVLVTPDAERSMNTYLGAAVEFDSDDIDADTLRNSAITYLEGYLFDPPAAKQAFRHAAKIVREANKQLALTLSDVFCVERHRSEFIDLIKNDIDILFANENELMALYKTDDLQQAIEHVRGHCKISVTTRSEKGAIVASDKETHRISAVKVQKLVDTTGAGDLFAAGFLYGLTHNKPLAEAGHIGAIASAEAISHYGPRPQEDLKKLIG